MIITMILVGLATLVVIAVVVGITDARNDRAWRRIAAERRHNWELRQAVAGHGPESVDAYADEDD